MDSKILLLLVAIFVVLAWLKRRPQSMAARFAVTWFGPIPGERESWASFQFRWALYALKWFAGFAVVFGLVVAAGMRFPEVVDHLGLLALFAFVLPLAACMALIAAVGFLLKAANARFLGPNPLWIAPEEEARALEAEHNDDAGQSIERRVMTDDLKESGPNRPPGK